MEYVLNKRLIILLVLSAVLVIFISLFENSELVYSDNSPSIETKAYFSGLYNDYYVSENILYFAKYEIVEVYDISNITLPVKIGEYYQSGCNFKAVAVENNNLYVTANSSNCGFDLNVLDISDYSNIVSIYSDPININSAGIGTKIKVRNNIVYIAYNQGGIAIVDFSSGTPIINSFNPTPGLSYSDIDVNGIYAYLSVSTGGFVVIDVSNPSSPNYVIGVDLPQGQFASYWPSGIMFYGNKVFIAGGIVNKVFDVSDITSISEVSSFPANRYSRDIFVNGEYIFVADDRDGIFAYSNSDVVSSYSNGSAFYKISLSNNYLFALSRTGDTGVYILSFSGIELNTTPTPTIVPYPEPFLSLPWDYESKGMSFSDAALAINSYFDHEFPLLTFWNENTGWCLPDDEENLPIDITGMLKELPLNVMRFDGLKSTELNYNCHDGYDYGRSRAKVEYGDNVLAAAAGCAVYKHTNAGGNTIRIDHNNGYQT